MEKIVAIRLKKYLQLYIDWLIKIGKLKFSIFGVIVLAIYALFIQMVVSLIVVGTIHWSDIFRSITFGLISAPFAIYFFSLIIEKLSRSRDHLKTTLTEIKHMQRYEHSLNQELNTKNLLLSQEIEERSNAEQELISTLASLEQEIRKSNRITLQLEQQAKFLRSFFDASPDLIFYRSSDHYYLAANRQMELLTNKSEAELKLLRPEDVYQDDIAQRAIETDNEALTTKKDVRYEQWFHNDNNPSRCFEILKVPFFDKVTQEYIIFGFGRDITERASYQRMIEQNSRDKTVLMSTISHELKTPLNGIIGLTRILLDDNISTQQRNYLQTIKASAVSLGHIFNGIVNLEKIETNRIELFKKEVHLPTLLTDIDNISSFLATQKGLTFTLECDESLPEWVNIDGIRLNQILWNIISNGIKFTQDGGVTLKVMSPERGRISFKVSDTGIGMPQSELKNIFKMYYQVKSKDNMKALGSGIGLAVCHQIVTLMDGKLEVDSRENIGSTFSFSISAPEITSSNFQLQSPVIKGLHILLVEDIEVNVIVARSVLEKFDYTVDVAMTGQEALDKFSMNEYDLVLLDIQLPDMTGFDVAQGMRKMYYNDEIDFLPPLVALTANVVNARSEYLDNGMDDLLQKPLSVKALNHCLMYLFKDEIEQNIESEQTYESNKIAKANDLHSQLKRFDEEMLEDLVSLLNKESVLQNISYFEELMPNYIQDMRQKYNVYCGNKDESKALAEELHKIKGAAASIGLSKIKDLAELGQHYERDEWGEHIEEWVIEIEENWKIELDALQEWLQNL